MLESLAGRLRRDHPELEVAVVAADLSESGGRLRVKERLDELGWNPDLLINNAGLGDYGEFASAEWGKTRAMLAVNIEALTHLAHLMVPGMIERGGGAIMNVSSLASLLPIPDFAVYAATKAYVTSFSEALRIELHGHGIEVLAVCPGPVHTEFGEVAKRGSNKRGMPAHKYFYISKRQVVDESLRALEKRRARVFPGCRIRLAALFISVIPIRLMRKLMGLRPRRS
jgi:uncharacterized protein